jgi:8-amino-7-oxononanoate synthase
LTGFNDISVRLESLQRRRLYRRRSVVTGSQGPELMVDGRKRLNFCSNDYLNLAADPRVRAAFKSAVDDWGVGSGASHLVCGHTAAHEELEEALAEFTGRERALLFASGYAANLGAINALIGKADHVFEDRLNHASLLDGGWISQAAFHWFEHRDMQDLDVQLSGDSVSTGRKLIVSDGTFSMDGDCCSLDQMIRLAHRHDALVMIDDAHGLGVTGRGGRGLVDATKYTSADVPLLMGTLGKALGTFGAFVAGDHAVIEMLIQRARNYIYTTALPSAIAVATLRSLAIVREEEWRRVHVRSLIQRFRSGVGELGLELTESATPIQPIIIGEAGAAVAFSEALAERDIMITAIRPPTVPAGTSRLRITLTAGHSEEHIDRLLAALADVQRLPER